MRARDDLSWEPPPGWTSQLGTVRPISALRYSASSSGASAGCLMSHQASLEASCHQGTGWKCASFSVHALTDRFSLHLCPLNGGKYIE